MSLTFHEAVFSGELAQLARASALQAEGQGFESPILHRLTDLFCMFFDSTRERSEKLKKDG